MTAEMARVIYFEILAKTPERLIRFYKNVFGWEFNRRDGSEQYWLIRTGPDLLPGIDGGLRPTRGQTARTVNMIDVASIDEAIATIEREGGMVAYPKMSIADVGWIAYCQDPEGNVLGLIQTLAPYITTSHDVIDRMLELAALTSKDVVYDLGCGDGRIIIAAARQYGARGVGIDINPERIALCQSNARRAAVEHLVDFRLQDALTADVRPATVVMLYLSVAANLKLRPLLTEYLRPGSRIVSHGYGMGDWEPSKVVNFQDASGYMRALYLWRADGIPRPLNSDKRS